MSIWCYADRLSPLPRPDNCLTLGEGQTPLLRSRSIGPSLGLANLHFKLETLNPTGSYKDRFAAAALSHLMDQHEPRLCLGTSSGNSGAALAAYAAAARIPCVLAILENVPKAKLHQMLAYGAQLIRIRGFGTDAEVTRQVAIGLESLASDLKTTVQISAFRHAPLGMAGVQTIAWETAEDLPDGIDHCFVPSGGGGLALAVARGFQSLAADPAHPAGPAVHCLQPKGNDTIATPLRQGADHAHACDCSTKISGLQVASVIDGDQTLQSCRSSGGTGHCVDDETVFAFQRRLALEEGIFAEPAGAVSLAGAAQAALTEEIDPGSTIVCLVTGSGFKDAPAVERMTRDLPCPLVDSFAQFEAIVRQRP